ncbi:hypothetical protein EE612_053153 [Oryza sativa]|nr:hypothetical protein EE612_053153 [Oryza sativa]
MSGKDQKKATTALEEKLELLRDVTKSSAEKRDINPCRCVQVHQRAQGQGISGA